MKGDISVPLSTACLVIGLLLMEAGVDTLGLGFVGYSLGISVSMLTRGGK